MALELGTVIDNKYQIIKLLGEGGMGAVFEGENLRIKRRVAIKVLHGAIASDAGAMRRFEHEAQAAGHIGNEHIIEVLDLGELGNGDRFMVMEYLDGEPLADRIRRMGHLSPEQAVPIFLQILEGLAAAHEAGILHRDLKPDNIFLLTEKMGHKDFVKIIDFGISKFQPLSGEMKMTRTGTIMGTPYYMSPEQASGSKDTSPQSDIYAVGVILYEALTGRVPFDAPTFNQLLFRIVLSEPPPIQQLAPDLNPQFASIVSKAMARDPAHRFPSATAFISALDSWAKDGTGVSLPPVAPGDAIVPDANANTMMAFEPAGGGALTAPLGSPPGRAPTLRGNPSAVAQAAAAGLMEPSGVIVNGATGAAWTNTPLTPRNSGNTKYLIGAAAALLLGAGGLWAMSGGGSGDSAAAAAPLAPVPAEAPSPAAEAAPPPAKAAPERANEASETAPSGGPAAKPEITPEGSVPTSAASAGPAATATATPVAAAPPKARSNASPPRRTSGKPKAAAKKKKLDFGY